MRARQWVGDHVLATTAALSTASIALVVAAARQAIPPAVLPHPPAGVLAAIPHLNAAIVAVAFVAVGQGWRWIRAGEVRRHRVAMLTGFALFVAFLVLYLYRVALHGPTTFGGTGLVRTAYLVVLGVHVALAVVCIPLVYHVLLLAATRPVAALPETAHPRVGRVAAALWLVSFALGEVVYLALYVA
ncbi:MAG: DUF420 domain-containing protein [Halobacteriaceae archaeon]